MYKNLLLDIVEIQIEDIHDETVRKVCENFQYLDMGIFVHILSSSDENGQKQTISRKT